MLDCPIPGKPVQQPEGNKSNLTQRARCIYASALDTVALGQISNQHQVGSVLNQCVCDLSIGLHLEASQQHRVPPQSQQTHGAAASRRRRTSRSANPASTSIAGHPATGQHPRRRSHDRKAGDATAFTFSRVQKNPVGSTEIATYSPARGEGLTGRSAVTTVLETTPPASQQEISKDRDSVPVCACDSRSVETAGRSKAQRRAWYAVLTSGCIPSGLRHRAAPSDEPAARLHPLSFTRSFPHC